MYDLKSSQPKPRKVNDTDPRTLKKSAVIRGKDAPTVGSKIHEGLLDIRQSWQNIGDCTLELFLKSGLFQQSTEFLMPSQDL